MIAPDYALAVAIVGFLLIAVLGLTGYQVFGVAVIAVLFLVIYCVIARTKSRAETGRIAASTEALLATALQVERLRRQRDANRQRYAEALGRLRRLTNDYEWRPSIDGNGAKGDLIDD
jgi:hypothetical protein